MSAEIGRVLGGRYRLVAPIGLGASAQVFLADDVRLRRRVALKMLHDALAGDADFLRRFRAEAQAAAALSHPNVLAVYDWGDDEVAYIVTEFLAGGSLRALLDRGGTLTPSQALAVGLEAARGLDYAHRRGFVHRDIKPANLLFGDDHRLRIADFGLARALAEAAWTEPQGAMLGTARYAAPEQAKGEKLSGKADVYALALVIVEAVTGDVPFRADTTLGTLMARVDRPLEVPEALGPLVPVLTRAGHPDPAQRIDARSLAAGLLRAAKELPRPDLLPLAGALESAAVDAPDREPTLHAPILTTDAAPPSVGADLDDDDLGLDPPDWVSNAEPALLVAAGLEAVGHDDAPPASADHLDGVAPDGEPFDHEDPAVADGTDRADLTDGAGEADDPDEADAPAEVAAAVVALDGDGPDRFEVDDRPTAELAVADEDRTLVAAGAVGAGGHGETALVDPHPPAQRPTEERTRWGAGDPAAGRDRTAPVAAIVPPDELPPEPPGDEEPAEPRRRRRWPYVAAAVLLVAGGAGVAAALAYEPPEKAPAPPPVLLPVPGVRGLDPDQATRLLEGSGWTVKTTRTRHVDTVAGQLLGVQPAPGTRLEKSGTVTLIVSEGQPMVEVPQDLGGRPIEEVQGILAMGGLPSTVTETRHHEDVPAGSLIQFAEGTPPTIERGTEIGLVASDGPAPREVPRGLSGRTEEAAKAAIEAVGLVAQVERAFSDDVKEGIVMGQQPVDGTLARGGTVVITVSRGPELVKVPDVSWTETAKQASAVLRRAGLVPGKVTGPAEGTPKRTKPAYGSEVAKGTKVDIVLG